MTAPPLVGCVVWSHTILDHPWQCIAIDLFDIDGHTYLLTVDSFSKYHLVIYTPVPVSNKAVTVIIRAYCTQFGRPDEIMSDNGTLYTGEAFQKFIREWNIEHVTSSLRYPQSNGFIERHVKHIKPLIRKQGRKRMIFS